MAENTAASPRLFCFGLGYTALALAEALRGEGWRIAGTCRGEDKLRRLQAEGIDAYRFDSDRPLDDPAKALAGATHILASVPPDGDGDPVLRQHGRDLAALRGLAWIGYLSTTGVYGDRGGAWVDETAAPRPATDRGRRRLAAEEEWLALWRSHGLPVHLFRLAGIYGPGRNQLVALRRGEAKHVDKPGQVFSRIHVADAAAALRASMARPNPGAAYNLADDEPAPPQDVVAYAAGLLGTEPPPLVPFAEAELSPMARSFYAESKRISNRRIKDELGVRLRFPDYRTGLAALLASES